MSAPPLSALPTAENLATFLRKHYKAGWIEDNGGEEGFALNVATHARSLELQGYGTLSRHSTWSGSVYFNRALQYLPGIPGYGITPAAWVDAR